MKDDAATPPDVDVIEVALTLGMKVEEIIGCRVTGDGTEVQTHDGQTYIIVPDDRPDDEGKTGVMWLNPPPRIVGGEAKPYRGSFPVFVPRRPDAETSGW